MAKQQEKASRFKVSWVPGGTVIPTEGVDVDPFKGTVRDEIVTDKRALVKLAYEHGAVSFEEALAALNNLDYHNRSRGKGVLTDQRMKPTTRAQKYMEYAEAIGMSPEDAEKRVMEEITSQRLAGTWGTIEREGLSLDEVLSKLRSKGVKVENA